MCRALILLELKCANQLTSIKTGQRISTVFVCHFWFCQRNPKSATGTTSGYIKALCDLNLKIIWSFNNFKMPTCSAINCSYKHCRQKTPGKSIHKFPLSRPDIVKRWVLNMRRAKFEPTKSSVLCSAHFEDSCYEEVGKQRRLKKDAVPTIFNFPEHLLKVNKERKSPVKRLTEEPFNHNSAEALIPRFHCYQTSPSKLKRQLEEAREECQSLRKRLKAEKQVSKWWKMKAASLNEVIKNLKNENLISKAASASEMIENPPVDLYPTS